MLRYLSVFLFCFSFEQAWAQNTDALKRFIDEPSRESARKLVKHHNIVIPSLDALLFNDQGGLRETDISRRLLILNALIAMPSSEPKIALLKKISLHESVTASEKLLALHYAVFAGDPDDAMLAQFVQDLSTLDYANRNEDLDFAFHGERGLSLLISLLEFEYPAGSDSVALFVSLLQRDFPRDFDEIVTRFCKQQVRDVFALTRPDAMAKIDLISGILSELNNDTWKQDEIAKLVGDENLNGFDDQAKIREYLLEAFVTSLNDVSEVWQNETLPKVLNFYINPHTSPQPSSETDEHFAERRRRLLALTSLCLRLQNRKKGVVSAFEKALANKAIEIMSSDMVEFSAGMQRFYANSYNPGRAITTLLGASKEVPIAAGLSLIRAIPNGDWLTNVNRDAVLSRIQTLALHPQGAPEAIRIQAKATLLHIKGRQQSDDYTWLLNGLASTEPNLRLEVLNILREKSFDSAEITENLARLITHEKDETVKLAAIEWVGELLDQTSRKTPTTISDSKAMGIALLSTLKDPNSKLANAARDVLSRYLLLSSEADAVLDLGIKSSYAEIVRTAKREAQKKAIGTFKLAALGLHSQLRDASNQTPEAVEARKTIEEALMKIEYVLASVGNFED